ncbi:uncharacterized protein B0H64DRAFT_466314 [Chaetomium fimeti]|uniref:Uncharacterized protein n=1 Tax=Chaetomium fimeti TaxID=1854472 RepID=A0AAE0HBY2_9PEZI|nr:hypothetical protein B0H64DRAFT_466314 [Chaetomium fimeti]
MGTTPPDEPNFVGYVASSDRDPLHDTLFRCDADRTRTVSGGYGTCCAVSTECGIPTACLAGTKFYEGSRRSCASDSSCATITILSRSVSPPDTSGMIIDYVCEPTSTEWKYSTLYLENPVPETSGSATLPASTGATGDSSSSSNAWIAGAIIGPVVALALVVVGVILLWKRKKRASQGQQQQPPNQGVPGKPELEGSQGNTVTGAFGAPWQKAELGGGQPRVPGLNDRNRPAANTAELRGSEAHQPSELSPDAVPMTTFELEACVRGPHELAPYPFEEPPGSGLEGPRPGMGGSPFVNNEAKQPADILVILVRKPVVGDISGKNADLGKYRITLPEVHYAPGDVIVNYRQE